MLTLTVPFRKIKLWKNRDRVTGGIEIEANLPNPDAPLTPGHNPIIKTSFQVQGASGFELGSAGSVSLRINNGETASLVPIWKEDTSAARSLVREYDLAGLLKPDNMLLALTLGTKGGMKVKAPFRYNMIKAGTTLEAGIDAGYVRIKSYHRTNSFGLIVEDFFRSLQMPSIIIEPPDEGEIAALEYGGYLNFGINASAGFEIKGTKSFNIRDLKLSEHYERSIVGKLDLSALVAGRFSVQTRCGDNPDWVRVIVRRKQARELGFAADVSAKARLRTGNLPRSGKEFLGAVLGVNAKNWINLIAGFMNEAGNPPSVVDTHKNIADTHKALDGLAGDFMKDWSGNRIDDLLPGETGDFLNRVHQVSDSYRELGNHAVSLFERYFDPHTSQTEELTRNLLKLKGMASWDQIEEEANPELWNVLCQLTDGDPLGWALVRTDLPEAGSASSLDELKNRIDSTLSLILDPQHEEIRRVIRLAGERFRLEELLGGLDRITSPDTLREIAFTRLGHFISRLIGQPLEKLKTKRKIREAYRIVREVAAGRDKFWVTFDRKFEEAAGKTFSLNIHDGYRQATERDALIDVEIRLQQNGRILPSGRRLMKSAGRCDFRKILAQYQPDLVHLHEGILTHRLTRDCSFKFNIVGWHLNHSYESMHRLIVGAQQRIVPSEYGQLTVFTNLEMQTESAKHRNRGTRNAEAIQTSFLLRLLGETHHVIDASDFNEKDLQYAVEVITGRSAGYRLTFTDKNAGPAELDNYLAFAGELGLDRAGATREDLAPVLGLKDASCGEITASYDVRFTSEGVGRLFSEGATDKQIRTLLRQIVLANYCGRGNIAEVAWLYCSDSARELWEENEADFISTESMLAAALPLRFTLPIPGLKPPGINNSRFNRFMVSVLFSIERDMINAFRKLQDVLTSKSKMPPEQYENRLRDFGGVLDWFDRRDLGDNTLFAVFDGLIRLHATSAEARASSLKLIVKRDGKKRTLVFALPRN